MVLFEELDVGLGVSANGLGKANGDSMEIVEVHVRVALESAADDWVIAPLDLDKVGNAFAPIFFGNF